MNTSSRSLCLVLVSLMLASLASSQNITICGKGKSPYKYALCAASTCTPTGNMIATNGGNQSYPEVVCSCPVIEGMAIAAPQNGNMQGSCSYPIIDGQVGVWR